MTGSAIEILLILGLATWRLSSMLVDEEGPWLVFVRLRQVLGVSYNEASVAYGTNEIAQALTCVWCTSVWVGLAFYMAQVLWPTFILVVSPLAASAIAILAQSAVDRCRPR